MFSKRLILAAVIAAGFVTASCSKDPPTDPLAFAPANTPYLLANVEPVPAASIEMWMKNAEQMMPMYEKVLDGMVTDLEKKTPDALGVRVVKALRDEMKGKINRAGMESLGWTMSSRSAFYGIGLIPVMRVELGDPEKFKAFIARMETKVGQKLATGKAGDQDYWTAGPAEDKLQFIIALQGTHLVMTFAPKSADQKILEQLLGLELPSESALDADVLAKFNKDRGYLPYGSGYIDTAKLLTLVFGERTPTEKAFLESLGEKNPVAEVSAVCKTEAQSIAAQVPRVSFGYTALDAKSMDLRYMLETNPAVGAELAKLAVTVPGLDGHGEGLFDVGFGIDLNALVSFVNAKSSAVAAAPYQCESLKPLNEAFASARTGMSNPGIFMAASAIKGFNASLSKFEMAEGQPPMLEGKIAFASDNPQSLLAMAGSFAPPVASLTLQPNQAPVAMPMDALPPGTPPTYVAMSDKALGFAIGESQQASLQAFLKSDSKTPSPLLHYGLDGAGMATFFDMMVKQSETALAAAESMQSMDSEAVVSSEETATEDAADGETQTTSGDSAQKVAEMRAALDSMKAMRDIYTQSIARADFSMHATTRGIEMGYALQMK